MLAAVLAGFLVLTVQRIPLPSGFVRAFLFFAIPLGALAFVAGRHWTAIFRPVRLRDVGRAHILNDWAMFGVSILGARLTAG